MTDLVKRLEKARRVWGPETDENSAITEAITALSSQATRDEVLEEAAAACDALVGRGFDPADCALDIRALKQQPWTREDGTTSPVRTGPDDRRKSADGSFDYDDCPLRRDRKGPGGIGYGRRSGDRARWTAQPRAVDYLDARDALPAPSSGKSRIANVPRGGVNSHWWAISVKQRREIKALQSQLTEAQEKQRKGTQPTAPEDMRRAAIRAALEAAEGRIRYLRDCYPTAEGITALDRAREELLNLSPDDILKRL